MDPAMEAFYESVTSEVLFLSVVSIGELYFGLNLMPMGKRREALNGWLVTVEESFANKILGVDEQLSRRWGQLRADIQKRGFTIAYNDLLIAATALRHDLTVVTRNVRDFAPTGCRFMNPWEPTT